jgi:NADH-quinone oxidoreductase subunit A
MLSDYIPILIIFLLATGIGLFVVVGGHLLGPRRPTKVKGQPYESGMIPYGPGTRRVSIRYYVIAMLFIIFDIELIFLLPWAIVFRQLGLFALIEMFIFLIVLIVGYIYAWKKGALEWD